ncbi:MAG TPA: kinase/pyrophosphorylase [Thermodesulfobium narugense]|nr:MAG: phosphoenolpyruvate synthase regulatory protein [Thermodesulfobium narugense]HEM56482.1 kinase/pyrophosphorylase [Thermodesulfobium narugense]
MNILILSDSTGHTAQAVAVAATSLFPENAIDFRIKRIPYVTDEKKLIEILENINPEDTLILYTIVTSQLRSLLKDEVEKRSIKAVDVLGQTIDAIKTFTRQSPIEKPGILHKLDTMYFSRVEAIEFAVRCDDGRANLGDLLKADLILIGVSRTSKTPLSMYMAHQGYKVANIPLVLGIEPPSILFDMPKEKIIGLTIEPNALAAIRAKRLEKMGITGMKAYMDIRFVEEELLFAKNIMKRIGCKVVDATNKAVEETATEILNILSNNKIS